MECYVAHVVVLILARSISKRKTRVKGRVKWTSFVDLAHVQNTYDISYWIGFVGWCVWWDIYDRGYNVTAGLLGILIMFARTFWIIHTHTYFFIPAVITSLSMAYAAFSNFLK